MSEVQTFVKNCNTGEWPNSIASSMQNQLTSLCGDSALLADQLETFSNSSLIQLINETAGFIKQLVENGHARLLQAGDVLLLPQEDEMNCCWHSVCCVGDQTGQALSFAVRGDN